MRLRKHGLQLESNVYNFGKFYMEFIFLLAQSTAMFSSITCFILQVCVVFEKEQIMEKCYISLSLQALRSACYAI